MLVNRDEKIPVDKDGHKQVVQQSWRGKFKVKKMVRGADDAKVLGSGIYFEAPLGDVPKGPSNELCTVK
jgi:hypothetical protein